MVSRQLHAPWGLESMEYVLIGFLSCGFTLNVTLSLMIVMSQALSPYVEGMFIYEVLQQLKPSDPILPGDDEYILPFQADYNEFTVLQGWMKQYLKYL